MPTKKPRVQTILNEDIYEKFKTLCDKEMRTESQMASIIITKYINDYEAQQNRTEQKSKLEKSSISKVIYLKDWLKKLMKKRSSTRCSAGRRIP